jgi:hypothetical protein
MLQLEVTDTGRIKRLNESIFGPTAQFQAKQEITIAKCRTMHTSNQL